MKLKIEKRLSVKKSDSNRIRREGNIPAVLYSQGVANENISVDGVQFAEVLRKMVSGRLSTIKFSLVDGDAEVSAVVKDIQYHPTTYQVLHMDFERLIPGSPITLNVPVEFTGVATCTGIKLGGFLRTVVRHLKVSCVPEKIPEFFTLDVEKLAIGQSLRLSSIKMPEGVVPKGALTEVAVVIAKR
jgi:large subunit ribosomal protein L25